MGILGLTHETSGNSLQRLPVTTKVSIGEAPKAGKNYPTRLDHFQFLEKSMEGTEAVWKVDEDVTKAMVEAYGQNPREIGIVLLDDDPENVFKTSLAWWTATEWRCKGSLVQVENNLYEMRAIRKTEKFPDGEPWPGNYKHAGDSPKKGQPAEPCGEGCPDLEEGRCKPSGDLYFILEKYPSFGGVCRIHTTSYRSIRNIANGLQQIRSLLGGRLGGIRVTLKVAPEKVNYEADDGKKKSSTAHILSLNLAAETLPKLIDKMTEFSKLFQETRKLLGGRTIVVEDEDESPDHAREITQEFHPQNALPAATVPKSEIPSEEEIEQLHKIHKMCGELGFNQAKESMLLGQHKGRLEELAAKLKELVGDPAAPAATNGGNGGPKAEPAKAATSAKSGKKGTTEDFAF